MSVTVTSKDSLGPTRKIQPEAVTPYKLTVVVLIKCYCQFKESEEMLEIFLTERVKLRKSFSLLSLKILQGPDLGLSELKSLLASTNSLDAVFEKFHENLREICANGIGYLLDVVDELKILLNRDLNQFDATFVANMSISKSSAVGFFLRRFVVFFEKLSFSEVSSLYEAFLRYYDKGSIFSPFGGQKKEFSLISAHSKFSQWYVEEKAWSRRQAELFLATQASLLENDVERALPPKELQSKISAILKSNPDLAEAHFLSFLNYLRVEEFCGAMQSLLHCFDQKVNPDVKCYCDEKSKEYRYAALNLAILHFHFGHKQEALASLKEAIKIAHEVNDNLCLQHALSWLYRLSNANKQKENNLILQCIVKANDLHLTYTTSLAVQNFGQFASSTACVKPNMIFEFLAKSDKINCQHNYKQLMFNNNALKASIWRLFGKTDMCSLWSQVLLYLNIDTVSQTISYYGEGYLQAVCNTTLNFLLDGEYNMVNLLLQYAKRKFPHEPLARTWMLVENWATYTRSLYQGKWTDAESAAQKILVFDKWEGYLKLADLYFYQEEYVKATKCISYILKNYDDNALLEDGKFCLLRAKILQVEIQFASAQPDLSGSMLSLSECLVEAENFELAYQVALVHLHTANVLLSFGFTIQALRVLNNPKCMIEILANGGQFDKARANLLYVKCLIADSSQIDATSRLGVLEKCVKMLEQIKNDFGKVEAYTRVKDVLYLQAQLYNSLNLTTERNDCALEYRLLLEEHPINHTKTLIKLL